jgi:RHS repeat-associated protein
LSQACSRSPLCPSPGSSSTSANTPPARSANSARTDRCGGSRRQCRERRARPVDLQLVHTHHWGPDLSGTLKGASGVGGLVLTRHHQANGQTSSYIPAYDGTGNVLALFDTATWKRAAEYEYGPFGELFRVTGPAAKANSLRWSTRVRDEETGLSYYGYRYYDPTEARWISRDPLGELADGPNVFSYVRNRPINSVDPLGLCETKFGTQASPGARQNCQVIDFVFQMQQPDLNSDTNIEIVKAAIAGLEVVAAGHGVLEGDPLTPSYEIPNIANHSAGHALDLGIESINKEYELINEINRGYLWVTVECEECTEGLCFDTWKKKKTLIQYGKVNDTGDRGVPWDNAKDPTAKEMIEMLNDAPDIAENGFLSQ